MDRVDSTIGQVDSLEKMKQCMKDCFKNQNIKIRCCMFLMGFTGVGKTTMSHILSGSMVKTGMYDDENPDLPISAIDDDDQR